MKKLNQNLAPKISSGEMVNDLTPVGRFREYFYGSVRKLSKKLDLKLPENNHSYEVENTLNRLMVAAIKKNHFPTLQKVSETFCIKGGLEATSLVQLVEEDRLTELGANTIIESLIKNLCSFYEKKPPRNVKEIATTVYSMFPDYSIPCFIYVFNLSKKTKYKSLFEHITSHGITAEFLINWLHKHDVVREKEKEYLLAKKSKNHLFINEGSSLNSDKLTEISQAIKVISVKKKFLKEKTKQKKFNAPKEEEILKQMTLYHFLSEMSEIEMSYNDHITTTRNKLSGLRNKWLTEYKKLKAKLQDKTTDNNSNSLQSIYVKYHNSMKEYSFDLENTSQEQFIKFKLREFMSDINEAVKKLSSSLILNIGLNKLVESKNINSANELLNVIGFKSENRIYKDHELDLLIQNIVYYQNKIIHLEYTKYLDSELSSNNLPMEKSRYTRTEAKMWTNKNCYAKITKDARDIP